MPQPNGAIMTTTAVPTFYAKAEAIVLRLNTLIDAGSTLAEWYQPSDVPFSAMPHHRRYMVPRSTRRRSGLGIH